MKFNKRLRCASNLNFRSTITFLDLPTPSTAKRWSVVAIGIVAHSFIGRLLGGLRRRLRRAMSHLGCIRPANRVQLALVIPLDDELAGEVTKLQVEIQRKYGRNPGLEAFPHITLKMGFGATDIAPFEKFARKLAAEVPPLQISVKDFDSFDDGILFLNVEPNATLENLRQRILSELSVDHGVRAEWVEGPQFRFHITLAYGLSAHEFEELRSSYATRETRFEFRASHLDLFCYTGQQWVSYAHAELQGRPDSTQLRLP